jgi:hypothetical protein
MNLDSLKKLLDDVIMVNVHFKPLEDRNFLAYYEILREIPEGVFQLAARDILRMDHYVYPSAGKIYEAARRYWPAEPERLFEKTLHWLRTEQPGTHDEWPKIRGALKYIGRESALMEADVRELELLKKKWVEWFNRKAGDEAING